jgi:hypothetical protein
VGNKGFLQISLLNSNTQELLRVGDGIDPFHDIAPSNLKFMQYWAEQATASDQLNYLIYSPELDEFVYKQGLRFIRSGPEISRDGEPVQRYSLILTYSLHKFGEMFLKQQAQQGIHLLLLDQSGAFIAGEAPLGWRNSNRQMDMVSLPGWRLSHSPVAVSGWLNFTGLDPRKIDDGGSLGLTPFHRDLAGYQQFHSVGIIAGCAQTTDPEPGQPTSGLNAKGCEA